MKQKCWLILVMSAFLLLGTPLIVCAESSNASTLTRPDDLVGADGWDDLEDYGFVNDLMIVSALYAGMDSSDEGINNLGQPYVISAELEPNQFYTMSIDFLVVADHQNPDRYEDCKLQVRLPATLLANSPNAIGYGINGEGIENWADIFGLSSSENLDLCYVKDSCEFDFILGGEIRTLTDDAEALLFSHEEGLPIGECLDAAMVDTLPIDGHEIGYISLAFAFYTMPHQGSISTEDIALNYWAGQKLMQSPQVTPAPKGFCLAVRPDDDGTVEYLSQGKSSGSTMRRIVIGAVVALTLIAILGIVIYTKKHKDRSRRILDHFLEYLKSNDFDDDSDIYNDDDPN